MALDIAVGTVTAGANATNTATVSGLSFQPVAVILVSCRPNVAAASERNGGLYCGFFTSTSSRRCFDASWAHASATPTNKSAWRNDACLLVSQSSGAVYGLVDVSSITSDGFVIITDDTFEAWAMGYIAIGGSDLVSAEIVDFTLDTSTGTQNVTTSAVLNTGVNDKLVFVAGGVPAAANAAGVADGTLSVGVCAGDTPVNAMVMIGAQDTQDPSETWGHSRTGHSMAYSTTTDAVTARAYISAWLSNGFTITRDENGSASGTLRYSALVLKGGRYEVGSLTTSTGTSNQVESTTYVPKGLILGSGNKAESADDTAAATAEYSLGFAQSASARFCAASLNKDAAATSDVGAGMFTDRMYNNLSTAATIVTEGAQDLVSFDASPVGFTWVMDDADPVGSYVWYAVLADTPAAGISIPVVQHHRQRNF